MLPQFLIEKYNELKPLIKKRLKEFKQISSAQYFYEMCYCICTPQSKAENALLVQNKLENLNFLTNDLDPSAILNDKSHYIRFHNQKAQRLIRIKEQYPEIEKILLSDKSANEKRLWLRKNINGFGMKESAHFLRNIGYENLGILDRHILKHLVSCEIYSEIPKISTDKHYIQTEDKFREFAKETGISMDELDLLFWSYETGIILK